MKYLRLSILTMMMLVLTACNIQSVEQFEKMEQQERSIAEKEQLNEEPAIEKEESVSNLEQSNIVPEQEVKEQSTAEETVREETKQEQQSSVAKTEQEISAPKKQELIEEKPVNKPPVEQKVAEKEQPKVSETQKPVTDKPPVQNETQKPIAPPEPKKRYVTIAIRVDSLLKHWDLLDPSLQFEQYVPSSGAILKTTKYELLTDKDTVWDVLLRATKEHKIQIEYQGANENIYNSVYVEGINHLYEFSGGPLSGWMYKVNGIYPNYGASQYKLQEGDVIEWHYTVDLGRDLGHYWEGE